MGKLSRMHVSACRFYHSEAGRMNNHKLKHNAPPRQNCERLFESRSFR